jgi:tetratricopeptide (TPR) repeat protein
MSVRRLRPLGGLFLLASVLALTARAGAPPPTRTDTRADAVPSPGAPGTTPSGPGPTLFIPSRQDSVPPESAPAPLLIPGRPSPGDSAIRTLAQRARDAVALGFQLEASGTPGAAIASYRNAVKFDPTIPDANFRMAMLFLTRDQVGEATKCLAAEVEHHPENDEAIRQLGLCLARLGDADRAIQHLERLARRQPKEGANWHALGFAYLAARRPRDAESALRRALRLPPTTVEELRDLGAVLGALGRDAEARAQYRRALKLDPRDPPTWVNLGNLERRAGRPDSALACYRRAEAGDSSFALALQGQAQLLNEMKCDGEAVDAYRRWLLRRPDHHGARLEAVRLLDAIGREDEALALAREGTHQVVDAGQPHVILGMVLRGRGDTRGALAQLRRAEILFRGNADEQERVRKIIAALRASAPDSLRPLFTADSVAAAAAGR